jgi:hypothetical protein
MHASNMSKTPMSRNILVIGSSHNSKKSIVSGIVWTVLFPPIYEPIYNVSKCIWNKSYIFFFKFGFK